MVLSDQFIFVYWCLQWTNAILLMTRHPLGMPDMLRPNVGDARKLLRSRWATSFSDG